MKELIEQLQSRIKGMESISEKVKAINEIKIALHNVSPFKDEPVDCVLWVENKNVVANDYNPNEVAPPEMQLLEHSIRHDGYTQPIVTALYNQIGKEAEKDTREVIDGFHRSRVGKESEYVSSRMMGYLPVVTIKNDRTQKADRMAATVRHNRARGQHKVDSMSEMVLELKKRNWSDKKIGKELGMEPDEVLRLAQVSGLAEAFADYKFNEAWEIQVE